MNKVILRGRDEQLLIDHGNNQKFEVCALLFGKGNRVKFVYHTENIDESPVRFTISSKQLMEGYKLAGMLDLDVIGIFHSHPNNKAYPSVTDERFMKINPGVWIIWSDIEKNMKAFVLDDTYIIEPKEIEIIVKN